MRNVEDSHGEDLEVNQRDYDGDVCREIFFDVDSIINMKIKTM